MKNKYASFVFLFTLLITFVLLTPNKNATNRANALTTKSHNLVGIVSEQDQESNSLSGAHRFNERESEQNFSKNNLAAQSKDVELVYQFEDKDVNDIYVVGKTAYLASDSGFKIVNISNPSSPIQIGELDIGGIARKVIVEGNYAYLAADGIRVIDIIDPANPVLIDNIECCGPDLDTIKDFEISGNYLYSLWAMGALDPFTNQGGLIIYEITDPESITSVGSSTILSSSFVPGGYYDVTLVGSYAYISLGFQNLRIIDVSDPENPTNLTVSVPVNPYGMDIGGSIAYVIDGIYSGFQRLVDNLHFLNVSDPSNPTSAGSYELNDYAFDIAVKNDLAYVANSGDGLRILDTSDLNNPTEVGFYKDTGSARIVKVDENYFYLITGRFVDSKNIRILRILRYNPDADNSVVADFSASPDSGASPLTVNFSNLSSGDYDRCEWDFGDGRTKVSCANPTVKFNVKGEYSISLTVSGDGGEDTKTVENYIKVFDPPKADFSADPTSGGAALIVDFKNLSSGDYDHCEWDFGDGRTKVSCGDPTVKFKEPGKYTISLTVTGYGESDTKTEVDYIEVFGPPTADFSASPTKGTKPLMVDFTNLSTGVFDSCLWDFGDGRTKVSCGNPTVKFKEDGKYTISLNITGPGGKDSKVVKNYIEVVSSYTAYLPKLSSQ